MLRHLIFSIGTYPTDAFWERTIRDASVQSKKQFIAVMERFLEGVVQQAVDRSGYCIRDMRRETIEMTPLQLGLDILDVKKRRRCAMTCTGAFIARPNSEDFVVLNRCCLL